MRKSLAITESLLIFGMVAVAATLAVQIPNQINDLTKLVVLTSAQKVSQDIAGLISVSTSFPSDITVFYDLPSEASYTLTFDGKKVVVTSELKEPAVKIEKATSYSSVFIEPSVTLENPTKIKITKTFNTATSKNIYRVENA